MTYILSAVFFALVLLAVATLLHLMVRDYWVEIVAALKGELPVRRPHRSWPTSRVRASVRPRPRVTAPALRPQRAAS